MKTLSLYGVVSLTMLALASPLYATGDITRAKDDANVKALTDADEKEKVGMGPSETGKYEVEEGKKMMKDKAHTEAQEKGKVGMGPSETGKYEVEGGKKKMMKGSGSGDMSHTGDITRAKDDANVKALTDADEKEKVGMGPSETGEYEVEVGKKKMKDKAHTVSHEKGKVGMGPSETGKYEVESGKKKMMKDKAQEEEKVGMGPSETGKYEVEAGTEKKE